MKIQIALDLLDKKKALEICKKTSKYVDIIELGTPFIKKFGIGIAKEFKKFHKPLVADLKIMDAGALEAEMAFDAGASIITVCADTNDETIIATVKDTRKRKKKVMADLIGVDDLKKRIKEVLKFKVDYICLHTGIDIQKKVSVLTDLKKIALLIPKKKLVVAGGINEHNIKDIVKFNPAIIIVGGAITKAKNPEKIAKEIAKIVK